MNVVSVFDGISCGQESFRRLGIKPKNYFASEINKPSIKVTLDNFPNTKHIGDVTKLIVLDENGLVTEVSDTLKGLPKIDYLIGGSPCQGLSRAKSDRENLKDERSKLFFHFVAIKEWLLENNNPNLLFLLENVKPNKETKEIMDEKMAVESIEINSDCFSAQDRIRLYWTNIMVDTKNLKTSSLLIKDILEKEQTSEKIKDLKDKPKYLETVKNTKNYIAWDTSGKGHYSQQNRARFLDSKMNTLPKNNSGDKTRIYLGDYKYRNATVTELERLQTLPDGYTSILNSKVKRKGVIGDGWTVEVIVYILKDTV